MPPPIVIRLDYNFLALGHFSNKAGYVETYNFEDPAGAKARQLEIKIDATTGPMTIIWQCNRPFMLMPESNDYESILKLPLGVVPCLYRKNGELLVWAAVQSSLDPKGGRYPSYLELIFVPQAGSGNTNELDYTIIAAPYSACSPQKPKRRAMDASSVVRATITTTS